MRGAHALNFISYTYSWDKSTPGYFLSENPEDALYFSWDLLSDLLLLFFLHCREELGKNVNTDEAAALGE